MVRGLNGRFFFLEASSLCGSIVTSLNKPGHNVFLCLLGIIRVVIWTTPQEEFHEGESFLYQMLVAFSNSKSKLKPFQGYRLSSLELEKRLVNVARFCHVKVPFGSCWSRILCSWKGQ